MIMAAVAIVKTPRSRPISAWEVQLPGGVVCQSLLH